MGRFGDYLQGEVGMHSCYGREYSKFKSECSTCEVRSDCESLTQLRKQRNRANVKIAKKPKLRVRSFPSNGEPEWMEVEDNEVEDNEEEDNEEEEKEEVAGQQGQPVYYGWPNYYYQPPMQYHQVPNQQGYYAVQPQAPQGNPGTYTTSYRVPHPSGDMSYIFANPVGCSMPQPGEHWIVRVLKIILARVLAAFGLGIHDFFVRYQFPNYFWRMPRPTEETTPTQENLSLIQNA